jgi:hypothetical protein
LNSMTGMNVLLPEEELGLLLEELNMMPLDELREAMTECLKELTLDPTEEPGPIKSIMTKMDLMIRVWDQHTTSTNAELRGSSKHLVKVLKEIKRAYKL